MSILSQRKSRKGSPTRAVSPSCFHPGIFLKIGTSECSIIRKDLNPLEISTKRSKKLRDYGFQVNTDDAPTTPPPSDQLSFSSVESSPSSSANNSSSHEKENKRIVRKQAVPPGTERFCASCGVTKTPYWRDAWGENISLCNACGLRYAKFKKRCSSCYYVPRKEDKTSRSCSQCRGSWL